MLRVILTNGKEVNVDADDFLFGAVSLELYRGDKSVGEFNSYYVVGVHETVPGVVTVNEDGITLKPFEPKATPTEGDR